MSISTEQIQRICALARLELNPAEGEKMRNQLNQVFEMIEQMRSVDLSNIEPMSHPQAQTQRLRDDIVTDNDQRAKFQALTPHAEEGLYLVPRVVE